MTALRPMVYGGLLMFFFVATAFAQCPKMGMNFDNEPPGRLLPGNYYEYKGRAFLKRDELRSALGMYEIAAYWGNKTAQYNVGILYFVGGKSVTADRPRGAAWLRLAAASQQPEMVAALQKASASMTAVEHTQADAVWKQLQPKYADTFTRQRMITRYQTERRNVTGSRQGYIGNMTVCLPGGSEASGAFYYAQMDKAFETYVDTMFGHAEVGPLVPIAEPVPDK